MKKNPLKTVTNTTGKAAYIYITDNVDKGGGEAIKALQQYDIVPGHNPRAIRERSEGARERYKDIDTNTSVRDQFNRNSYEYFRPDEAIPSDSKEILGACMGAYRRVGIVRNVIDLMGDFGAQGVKLTHPNPRLQKFYRSWWKKVAGTDRTERSLNLLYRCGLFVIKRRMAKITIRQERQLIAEGKDKLQPDVEYEPSLETQKRNIPIRYVFMNPLMLEVLGGELGQFIGKQLYGVRVSAKIRNMINNPKAINKVLINELPADIVKAIKSGASIIPLDPKKITAKYYKKDDWQSWADPMIYAILDDLILLEKMKLADLAALDGAISQVRLWKLGDLDKGIFPTNTAVNRLIEILLSNTGGGAFDLVWGPDLTIEEYKTNVHMFLGKKKYEPVMDSIYAGLGVPPTLTGAATSSGFTNNYISLQTLIKRLEYGRGVIKSFWDQELELVRQAMGHKIAAKVVFDHNVLSDEAAMKALLIQLVDRDILSVDTIAERFGEDPEFEALKLQKENKQRKQKKLQAKAGPWHSPEKFHEYVKAAIPRGFLGIDLEEEWLTDEDTPFDRQLEIQKEKGKLPDSTPKGEPQQGRPLNSKDKEKRKQKEVKPVGASDEFMAMTLWAREAQTHISDAVTPLLLKKFNKTSQRSLSREESQQVEYFKFSILANLNPYSNVDKNIIKNMIDECGVLTIPHNMNKMCEELISNTRIRIGRELTLDEMRTLYAASYSFINI